MPYFLVTHTSLIEAKDELQAVDKTVDKIKAGRSLTFDVRIDEYNSKHITIPASDISGANIADVAMTPQVEAASTSEENISPPELHQQQQDTKELAKAETGHGTVQKISLFVAGLVAGGGLALGYIWPPF